MRWPFRRKGAAAPAMTSTSDATPAAAATGAPARVARPSGRHWLALPPLAVTVNRPAPLVAGPPPVLPPLPGHRSVSGPVVAPAMGRVEGLATVVPHVPEPVPTAGTARLPEPERRMVHPRRVRSEPPAATRAAMVEATGGFVGEAREPAVPHRAPGWMRYVPEWLSQSTQSEPEPAPAAPRPKPVLPPSKVVERPTTPVATSAPSMMDKPPLPERPARRASLGQSRRLGLGAPLKHPEEQPALEPVSSAAPEQAPRAVEPAAGEPTGGPSTRDDAEEDAEGEQPPAPPPERPPRAALRHPRPDPTPVPPIPATPVPPPQTARSTAPVGPVTPKPSGSRDVPAAVPLTYRAAPGRSRPRSVAPDPSPPARPPAPKRVAGYVPADLASALRGPHQVDVSSIPVHRGPEVSAQARALGARAFTRGGEVYLPDEAGPVDTPKARGLLAHELVHAVQQRTLGPTLPAAHTPAGAALEARAVEVEHAHSGHGGHAHIDPAPLVHPSLTQVISQAARTVGVQLAPLVATPPVVPPTVTPMLAPAPPAPDPVATAPLTPPARQEIDLLAEASAIRTLEEWTAPTAAEEALAIEAASAAAGTAEPPAGGFELPSFPDLPLPPELPLDHQRQDQGMAQQVLQVMNVERTMTGQAPLTTLDADAMDLIRRTVAEQTEAAAVRSVVFGQAAATGALGAEPVPAVPAPAQPAVPAAPAPPAGQVEAVLRPPAPVAVPAAPPVPELASADPSDQPIEVERLDLDQLAARIYDRLRTRIRMELLIDRERAGLLTDFR